MCNTICACQNYILWYSKILYIYIWVRTGISTSIVNIPKSMNGPGLTLGLTCQPDAAKDLGSNFRCSDFTAPDVDRQPNHPARQVKGKHLQQALAASSPILFRPGASTWWFGSGHRFSSEALAGKQKGWVRRTSDNLFQLHLIKDCN